MMLIIAMEVITEERRSRKIERNLDFLTGVEKSISFTFCSYKNCKVDKKPEFNCSFTLEDLTRCGSVYVCRLISVSVYSVY